MPRFRGMSVFPAFRPRGRAIPSPFLCARCRRCKSSASPDDGNREQKATALPRALRRRRRWRLRQTRGCRGSSFMEYRPWRPGHACTAHCLEITHTSPRRPRFMRTATATKRRGPPSRNPSGHNIDSGIGDCNQCMVLGSPLSILFSPTVTEKISP